MLSQSHCLYIYLCVCVSLPVSSVSVCLPRQIHLGSAAGTQILHLVFWQRITCRQWPHWKCKRLNIPSISPSLLSFLPSLHAPLMYPAVLRQQLCSASLSALTVLWNVTQDGKHLFMLLLLCSDYVSGLALSSCSINVPHFENENQLLLFFFLLSSRWPLDCVKVLCSSKPHREGVRGKMVADFVGCNPAYPHF